MSKKIILAGMLAIMLSCGNLFVSYAQEANNRSIKSTYEIGLGKSVLATRHNISPWGIRYRGNYSGGTNFNAQANYIFKDQRSSLGLKLDMFGTAGNYEIENNQLVAENINVFYLAPQIGSFYFINPRVSFFYGIGVGYALYQNGGLLNNTEYNIYSHMLGVNADMSLDYMLTKRVAIGGKFSVFGAFSDKQHREIEGNKSDISMDKWNKIQPIRTDFSIFLRRYFFAK